MEIINIRPTIPIYSVNHLLKQTNYLEEANPIDPGTLCSIFVSFQAARNGNSGNRIRNLD